MQTANKCRAAPPKIIHITVYLSFTLLVVYSCISCPAEKSVQRAATKIQAHPEEEDITRISKNMNNGHL